MASFSGSYKINTVIAHTAPAVLELLQGGVARSKNDIIAALAGRYSKNDITHTLMRLSVTGRLIETGRKYGLLAGFDERSSAKYLLPSRSGDERSCLTPWKGT
jgi:hypothetical protein